MKKNTFRFIRNTAVLCLSILVTNITVFGATYGDVPQTHWAYDDIAQLSEKGIMVGDSTGDFNPDQAVDKFYTAKVLAKALGFKYFDLTLEESTYISNAYEANEATLNQFKNSFEKWDSTADKEVAFLMQKGVLDTNDLNKFVVRFSDGSEKLVALTKEEYCKYLVNTLEDKSVLSSVSYLPKFSDDNLISDEYRAYVYYLKEKNVISGDSDNNFNPRNALTRASMAVMTNKFLNIDNTSSNETVNDNSTSKSDEEIGNNSTIYGISGDIYKVYAALNAIQFKDNDGSLNTYKFSSDSKVYIDGNLKTIQDLEEDMSFTAIVKGSLITELRAQKAISNSSKEDDNKPSESLTDVEGTVEEISSIGNNLKTITIKTSTVSAKGIVTSSSNTYIIDDNCSITRDNEKISLSDINFGEVVHAQVLDNIVYNISFEDEVLSIENGVLTDKKYDSNLNQAVFTIKYNNEIYELVADSGSYLFREDDGRCSWDTFKIGDMISLDCEYGVITNMYGFGEENKVTGWISAISITNDKSTIRVRESETVNSFSKEYIVSSTNDLYDLELNSKVRVKLDSDEVSRITVLETPSYESKNYRTGYIFTIKSNYFTLIDDLNSEDIYEKIYFDDDTKVVDAVKGKVLDPDDLYGDMKVYIKYDSESSKKYADIITVLEYN